MSIFRNKLWLSCSVVLLALFNARGITAQTEASTRRMNFEKAFKALPGVKPKLDHGFFISWKPDTLPSDMDANVVVLDRDGKLVGKTRIWVESAGLLKIHDVAARKDGHIAAVGFAVTSSGTFAAFLADVSVTQGSGRVVQTSPFRGRAIGYGPDGTIWVLGAELGPGDGREMAPDHYMVRHFGSDDVLKDQHLLRSDFGCELGRHGISRVVVSDDRVGFFAPQCRMWVELSPTGELLGRWSWNPISQNSASQISFGVALASTNELYGSWNMVSDRLYRFDRVSSEWLPVSTTAAEYAGVPFGLFVGTDGDAVVYMIADSSTELAWFKPRQTK